MTYTFIAIHMKVCRVMFHPTFPLFMTSLAIHLSFENPRVAVPIHVHPLLFQFNWSLINLEPWLVIVVTMYMLPKARPCTCLLD
jgi:hypothetical protein